jgi:hypothetical protein
MDHVQSFICFGACSLNCTTDCTTDGKVCDGKAGKCVTQTSYLAQVGEKCKNGYGLIKNQTECDEAAQFLVNTNLEYIGWNVNSWSPKGFVPNNTYTAGCYWNHGGISLWMNPYGVEAKCTDTQDCRTICRLKENGAN